MVGRRIAVGFIRPASELPLVDGGNVSRPKYEMKLCGSPADFVQLDRTQPEARKPVPSFKPSRAPLSRLARSCLVSETMLGRSDHRKAPPANMLPRITGS
jgi:hypothetical protein